MSIAKKELEEKRIKKILDIFIQMEYERFYNQIRPAIEIIKNRGHNIEEFARRVIGDEVEESVNNLNMRLRGIEVGLRGKLDETERKYLAGILFLQNELMLDYVLAPAVYEGLRSINLIRDIDKGRRRAQMARNILLQLKDKGVMKEISVNEKIKQSPPHIKYLYSLNNGKFISEIKNFDEYEEMKKHIDLIVKDKRFAKIKKTNKDVLELLKQSQLNY